jgi:hypothetical protein
MEAQPELPGPQRGGAGDGGAVCQVDGQMPTPGSDRHVSVVAERVDRSTQDLGVVRGGPRSLGSFARRRHGASLSRGLRRWPVAASLQWIAGESPPEGVSPITVPGRDAGQHRLPKLRGGAEAARTQALPLRDAEEQLDLVAPGGVLRR